MAENAEYNGDPVKSRSGIDTSPLEKALQGDITPPIRGTATSALQDGENASDRQDTTRPIPPGPMPPFQGAPGTKEQAQARRH